MQDPSALWEKLKTTREKETKDALIAYYLPLVRQIAAGIIRKLRPGVELDDLISDGVFGLIRAIDAFDVGRGVKFETYATPVVRGAIYNGLRTLDWVPERTRGKTRALQRAMEKFTLLYGRPGTEQELAEELKMSSAEVYELIADLGCVYLLSLDQPYTLSSEDEETTITDTIEDDKFVDPSVEVEFKEQREILKKAIDALGDREQVLVKMHYFESVPFESIADKMGVSKQRISQMHTRAIKKLRESLSSTHISEEALHNFSIEG